MFISWALTVQYKGSRLIKRVFLSSIVEIKCKYAAALHK